MIRLLFSYIEHDHNINYYTSPPFPPKHNQTLIGIHLFPYKKIQNLNSPVDHKRQTITDTKIINRNCIVTPFVPISKNPLMKRDSVL